MQVKTQGEQNLAFTLEQSIGHLDTEIVQWSVRQKVLLM